MHSEMNTTTKTCGTCKETRPVSSFSKHCRMADGLQNQCKLCQKDRSRLYHEQNKAAVLERHRQYYEQNSDTVLEYKRRYNAANPQAHGTKNALERSPLTESELFCGLSRSQVNAEVRFDYILRDLLTQKTGVQYHVDHIKPICEGGVHRMWNLAVVTEERNKAKGPIWFCEDHLSDEDIEAQDEATLAFVPAE